MKKIRIGTRSSNLAIAQAKAIAELITCKHVGIKLEMINITTSGDRDRTSPLEKIGGMGVFTKKIEEELLTNNIDIAVHSAKDLPSRMTRGLMIGAVPAREAYADAWISRDNIPLNQINSGSVVGTGSPRRKAMLLNNRLDLSVKGIRGNVETRLKKLNNGQYDALIMSQAGLKRLNLEHEITEILSADSFIPAPGQGSLVAQIRDGDDYLKEILDAINDPVASRCLKAERLLLEMLGAGCSAAVGGLARIENNMMIMKTAVLDKEGKTRLEASEKSANPQDDYDMVNSIVNDLFARGAKGLID
jgi:hydroxymethylbilane synthase